ncbi:MAG: putative DNA-binding domain-containing protein [Gammaproteobacteria bacterium]|jgi:hypothetical protein
MGTRDPAAEELLRQQQLEFAAHLRAPDRNPPPKDVEDRRMEIYRDLFINNVTNFLGNSFPVLSDLLGTQRWGMLIRDFYRDHQSRSPLFPDLPKEFLDYLINEREAGEHSDPEDDPPFLYELAHYEWVETGLALAEEPERDRRLKLEGDLLDGHPVTYQLAWLFSYSYPVNEISKDHQPDQPADQPLHYLVYRNEENKVKFLKLNVISARLFDILSTDSDISGRAALELIAQELSHPQPEKVVANGAAILEQWRTKGIIRGAR